MEPDTMPMEEYQQLLASQDFVEEGLDYTILERHIPFLEQLAQIGNSSISVFDMFRKKHVYTSPQFHLMLGYDTEQTEEEDSYDERIHPEDFVDLMKNGIELLRFCFDLTPEKRKDFKLLNEYRVRNAEEKYTRVIEQHQVLELDSHGNVWLVLSLVDISPNRDAKGGIKSRLVNFKTGEMFHFPVTPTATAPDPQLSSREQQVLGLIKQGLISKEIADRLYISVHTVNTHRQRILEKLNANNSHEAIEYASHLGVLN